MISLFFILTAKAQACLMADRENAKSVKLILIYL